MPAPRGMKPTVANPGKVFKRIMAFVFEKYLIQCIAVFVCIIISVIASVQGTLFMKTLIDDYITPLIGAGTPDYTGLLHELIRVGSFYLIGILATFVYNKIMVYVTQGTLDRLRREMFDHMEKLPIRYFDTHAHGDIMSMYTNDVDTLRQMISQSIPQFINSAITVISIVAGMISLSLPLTGVAFVMVAIMLICTKKVTGLSGKNFVAQQRDIGAVNGFIEEMMEGQKVVKVFCHEEEAESDFKKLNDRLFESAYKANAYANIIGPINAQLGNLSYVIIAIVGSILAINGAAGLTLGTIVSFLTFDKNLNMPINQISMQLNSVIMALAGGDRIFRLRRIMDT